MDSRKIRRLAFGGLLTALIAALTAFVRISIPGGYLNPGDAAVALAAALLGPYAAIPAALGSALADLMGYPQYAPFTFIIKGLMGLIAGYGMMGASRFGVRAMLGVLGAGAALIGGYFAADYILGDVGLALTDLPWNALQLVIFAVSSVIFKTPGVKKLSEKL